MWYLHSLNDTFIYLWEKDNYTVGRKHKDITIENDDSVSRNHAIIEIKNSELFITDTGSKYGTFIDSSRLTVKEQKKLTQNAVITFGILDNVHSKFKVKKINLKIVLSNVKPRDKSSLMNCLEFLKATKLSMWNESCTHVAVSEVVLTPKVLCALTVGQSIVHVKYFTDFVAAIKNNSSPPKIEDYVPELNETLLSKNIKLEYHPERKNLFKNTIFVFLTEKCKALMKNLIEIIGGTATSWENNELDLKKFQSKSPRYLLIEENTEDIDKNTKTYKSFQNATKFLSSISQRPIPFQEIALAIIYNSCKENCNPNFNRAALLVPESTQEPTSEIILGYDTQHSSGQQTQSSKKNEWTQDFPKVVEPSFNSETSTIFRENSGVKRSLEIDSSVLETSNKRAKENVPSSSSNSVFTFRRPSSQSTQVKNSSKLFPVSNISTSKTPSINEDCEMSENPFSKKRKATTTLNSEAKKKPLENIVNLTNVQKNESRNATKNISIINTSNILKNGTWLSKSSIKKEPKIEIKEEIENKELEAFNNLFKNCIKFNTLPIVEKRTEEKMETHTNGTVINFKKFRKVQKKIQSEIVDTIIYVCGNTSRSFEEDEDVREVENDEDFDNVPAKPKQTRKKFQFFT